MHLNLDEINEIIKAPELQQDQVSCQSVGIIGGLAKAALLDLQ